MGIPYLKNLLNDIDTGVPSHWRRVVNMRQYFGHTVVVDTSLILRKGMGKIRSMKGDDIRSTDGKRSITHIHVLFYKVISFLNHGIKPVFVFDGCPPSGVKDEILSERREQRKSDKENYEIAKKNGDEEKMKKYYGRLTTLGRTQVEKCKHLLSIMGIPYVHAPEESDSQCAALAMRPDVYGSVSDDTDLLIFGSPFLIRNLTNKYNKIPPDELNLVEIRKVLGIELSISDLTDKELIELYEKYDSDDCVEKYIQQKSQRRFVDLCILLGAGKISVIEGLNRQLALELIQNTGSLEGVIQELQLRNKKVIDDEKEPLYNIPSDYLESIQVKRSYLYGDSTNVFDPNEIDISLHSPNIHQLRKFLVDELGFPDNEIDSILPTIITRYPEGTSPFDTTGMSIDIKGMGTYHKRININHHRNPSMNEVHFQKTHGRFQRMHWNPSWNEKYAKRIKHVHF